MERLTMTSDKGGVAFTFDLDITCKPSEAQKILRLAEKLKHYEDLAEQGRLIELPCHCDKCIHSWMSEGATDYNCNKKKCKVSKDDFCKYAEAEAKLKELEGER